MTKMQPGNPFVGPSPLKFGQPLFGRDRELVQLRDLLMAERVVALYSPSGAGKTSLIQAGLITMLREAGFDVLPVIRLNHPSRSSRAAGEMNRYVQSTIRSLDLNTGPKLQLRDSLDTRSREPGSSAFDLLIFDQFEQILTLDPADSEAKAEFFTQVGEALRAGDRWALFSLREDHLAGLDPYRRWIPRRLSTGFRLDFLSPEAAREAIRRTAQYGGVEFAEDAADLLVKDLSRVRVQQPDGTVTEELGEAVEPVQLQVVCYRLFESLPQDNHLIDRALVARYGQVSDALRDYYSSNVADVANATGVPERDIRFWFDETLITKQGIRGQVLQEPDGSAGMPAAAVLALIDTHLVRQESARGARWLELSHDRLVDPIRADNEVWYQIHLSAFQQQAKLWYLQGRVVGLLLTDEALSQAKKWADDNQDLLTEMERDFLDESLENQLLRDAERTLLLETKTRQQAREKALHDAELQAKRLKLWLIVVALLLVAAVLLAVQR